MRSWCTYNSSNATGAAWRTNGRPSKEEAGSHTPKLVEILNQALEDIEGVVVLVLIEYSHLFLPSVTRVRAWEAEIYSTVRL
jgi:hypothetical protein